MLNKGAVLYHSARRCSYKNPGKNYTADQDEKIKKKEN
jgi:hypothetical protein